MICDRLGREVRELDRLVDVNTGIVCVLLDITINDTITYYTIISWRYREEFGSLSRVRYSTDFRFAATMEIIGAI